MAEFQEIRKEYHLYQLDMSNLNADSDKGRGTSQFEQEFGARYYYFHNLH